MQARLAQLVEEGVLYKRRGVGMFVADGAAEELRRQRREAFFAERLDPVLREARVLGIGAGELATYLTHAERNLATTEGGQA